MEHTSLTHICKNQDINALHTLVTAGFPLYLHLNEVFLLIMQGELTQLFDYVVTYIKRHPLNQMHHGYFYQEYHQKIRSYKLYLLLKHNPNENKIYDFISEVSHSYNGGGYPQLITENTLVSKIIALDLPNNIINIFRNYEIASICDVMEQGYTQRYNYIEEYQTQPNITMILSVSCEIDEHFWDGWDEISKKNQEEILKTFGEKSKAVYLRMKITGSIIRAGLQDVYFQLLYLNNMTPLIEEYIACCRWGDVDFALKVLMCVAGVRNNILLYADEIVRGVEATKKNVVTMEQFKSDAKIKNKIICIEKQYFITAFCNACRAKNPELIELNEFIINVCFKSKRKVQRKDSQFDIENKVGDEIKEILSVTGDDFAAVKNYLASVITALYEDPYGSRMSKLDCIKRIVEHMHMKKFTVRFVDDQEFNYTYYVVMYYLMSLGYREVLRRCVKFAQYVHLWNDDGRSSKGKSEDDKRYLAVMKHYEGQNVELKKVFLATDVMNRDQMGVVFEYLMF